MSGSLSLPSSTTRLIPIHLYLAESPPPTLTYPVLSRLQLLLLLLLLLLHLALPSSTFVWFLPSSSRTSPSSFVILLLSW